MSDRGMKKWAPYKALIEHEQVLNEARNKREEVEKPKISNERAEEINEVLTNYHGETLRVKYYRRGKILEEIIVIKRIDPLNKKLDLEDKPSIKFNELINLERVD